ncbi:MAG TPA: cation-translocating P-type ATPase [Verrucomicrobiae bacterium]|nr:cation-translocating P-type ATPase [Verrucomicrobiae bacterium]
MTTTPHTHEHGHSRLADAGCCHHGDDSNLRLRLSLVLFGALCLGVDGLIRLARPDQHDVAAVWAMIGTAIVALPVLWDSIVGLKSEGFAATKFYMDQFITLAVVACFAIGQYVTGGLVAIILVVGQVLEERTMLGAQEALDRLATLAKVRARRLLNGVEEEVDSDQLASGDRVRVRPGDTVPADGRVISGHSTINQATITGESVPVEVEDGDEVFAGTSNLTGSIEVEVTKTGDQTVLGHVRHIVEEAQTSRAPIMRLTEEYARYYTPLILIIAGFVLFFTRDATRAISVIIVSIPCAFVLASPAAMIAALACSSRLGILIKSVRFLEQAASIDTVVFDKTGTLTTGQLLVERIQPTGGLSEQELLMLAASVESHSSHPVARALVAEAQNRKLALTEATAVEEAHGHGVAAQLDKRKVLLGRASWLAAQGVSVSLNPREAHNLSVLHLAVNGELAGAIYLSDSVRAEAGDTATHLGRLGIKRLIMLTGDRQNVAEAVAANLGITEVRAECLPQHKLEVVNELKHEGRRVLVIGDGINDAPALAAGDLGVAMGALGSDVAIQTADAALMTEDIGRLPVLLALSRRTLQIIHMNLLAGLVFVVLAIIASSLGWVTPIVAAFIHEFGAFFVLLNSARLLRFEEQTRT